MRQLLWKEWHEQGWKLAFGCIVLSAIAVIGLRSRMVTDAVLLEGICILGATMLPILSSTGLVPAERAGGSFESLLAMPIAPWRILLAKTLMGMVLCAAPLAVAAIISALIAGDREILTADILEQYGRFTLTSVSFFIWMMVLTIRLPSEARAAMMGVGVLVLWWLVSAALILSKHLPPIVVAISPLVMMGQNPDFFDQRMTLGAIVLEQLIILISIWFLALSALRRPVEGRS